MTGIKGRFTNKQVSAMGTDKIDNGKIDHVKDKKEKQRKSDNVIPD